MIRLVFSLVISQIFATSLIFAHIPADEMHKHDSENVSTLHYLGHDGVMVSGQSSKVSYALFFHNHFGQYALVPDSIRAKIYANEAPYDNIDAIFVSYMHEDHFDILDTIKYLKRSLNKKVYLPHQTHETMLKSSGNVEIKDRLLTIDRKLGEEAIDVKLAEIMIEAIHIPHAGWLNLSYEQNLVLRVPTDNDYNVPL